MAALSRWIAGNATPRTIVVLFLVCVWLAEMFRARNQYLDEIAERSTPVARSLCAFGAETRTLDGLCFHDPGVIDALVASYGRAGRTFYATTQLTLDVVFPLAYALLLALALTWAVSRTFAAGPMRRLPILLPAAVALADVAENVGIAFILSVHPDRWPTVAWTTVVASTVKWLTLYLGLLVLVTAVARWAFRTVTAPTSA